MTTEDAQYATADEFGADDAYEIQELDVRLSRGRVVRVRGLSRLELLHGGKNTTDAAEVERRMIVDALVAPRMTLKQVEAWQRKPGSINDIGKITTAVRNLSGLGPGADKSDVAEVPH